MNNKSSKKIGIGILIAVLIVALVIAAIVVIRAVTGSKGEVDKTTGMLISDGVPQPIYNEGSDILRFVVYVETDYDTDLDGKRDLVKAVVQVPSKAAAGEVKVPVIYEGSPYKAGTDYREYEGENDSRLTEENLKSSPAPRVATGNSDSLTQAKNADYHSWNYTFPPKTSEGGENRKYL